MKDLLNLTEGFLYNRSAAAQRTALATAGAAEAAAATPATAAAILPLTPDCANAGYGVIFDSGGN